MASDHFDTIYQQLTHALDANHQANIAFRQAIEEGETRRTSALRAAQQNQQAAVSWADQALRTVNQALDEGRSQLIAVEISPAQMQPGVVAQTEETRPRAGLEQAQSQASSALIALKQARQYLLGIRALGRQRSQLLGYIAFVGGTAVVILLAVGGIIYTNASRPSQEASSTSVAPSDRMATQLTSEGIGRSTSVPATILPTTVQVERSTVTQPELASIAQPQPTSISIDFNFQVVGVRVGIADGKRLRVVVDLMPMKPESALDGLFEQPTSDPSSGTVTFVAHAQVHNDPPIQYMAEKAKASADLSLRTTPNGLEVRIVPRTNLYLRDIFVLPHTLPNQPNDRLVVDLCFTEDCPIMRR